MCVWYGCVQLVNVDAAWVPDEMGYSLYIRPTAIGTSPFLGVHASEEVKVYTILSPVGPYYSSGKSKPVTLLADEKNVRAWPGGVGDVKVGGNYAPTIDVGAKAQEQGYSQVHTPLPQLHLFLYLSVPLFFFLSILISIGLVHFCSRACE